MQALIGNILDRCITDAGYRGHNAPPDHKFKVYTSGQKRRVTPQIKREFKRRARLLAWLRLLLLRILIALSLPAQLKSV